MRLPLTRFPMSICAMALGLSMSDCGGSGSPTTVTTPPVASPTPAPPSAATPTPTPAAPTRVTFTLDASADHYLYSPSLARLAVGQSFVVKFRLLQLNHAEVEKYAHTMTFWLLWSGSPTTLASGQDGIAFGLEWYKDLAWYVFQYTPDWGYTDVDRLFQIGPGGGGSAELWRRDDGQIEFNIDGKNFDRIADRAGFAYVFAEVVGTKAEFSYDPQPSTSADPALVAPNSAPRPCGECPVRSAIRGHDTHLPVTGEPGVPRPTTAGSSVARKLGVPAIEVRHGRPEVLGLSRRHELREADYRRHGERSVEDPGDAYLTGGQPFVSREAAHPFGSEPRAGVLVAEEDCPRLTSSAWASTARPSARTVRSSLASNGTYSGQRG